jgi:hypothetical protein
MRRTLACLLLAALAAGCLPAPKPIPTVTTLEMLQTAQYLTKNAPPPGFEQGVQFPHIDDHLADVPSWHYVVSLSFDGVYADSNEKATGQISAEIFSNEVSGERRVLLKASGAVFGVGVRDVEGVRISNDYYLVDQNKVCTKVTDSPADSKVADLSAGSLIGGVKNATPVGERKTDNNFKVWEYTFLPEDVVPPALDLSKGGKFTIAAGDLWVSPADKAVYEYNITLNVENAVLQGNRPLTGQIRAAYQLLETGTAYNIAIPYGC